ncbi:type 12 methyltransferase [Parapedobacter pyrenivorans]|uniref:Type 12 methyltransferase n=2 Tax=Parapedobacter pyrenivorans TaxID=1305674 RepID=A0A917I010_9SPHI|nr:type 12 methyltransferase [Parapedobacter pyrenivorans]
MSMHQHYLEKNRTSWNKRAELHFGSEFYDVKSFLEGKTSLKPIELKLLSDIRGKTILHLQCHFGQDSLSLSRMGAQVTGIDLSDRAIAYAHELAHTMQQDSTFICCDIYDLPNYLTEKFDIVFTSYGTIGWLPDLDRWANIVSNFLKADGRFVFVEFHPYIWMFDDDLNEIRYSYFKEGPIIDFKDTSYTDGKLSEKTEDVSWNHSLSEVINSLIDNGLRINSFEEFDYSPYNIFAGSVEVEKGKFRVKKMGSKIPLVYSLVAVKC